MSEFHDLVSFIAEMYEEAPDRFAAGLADFFASIPPPHRPQAMLELGGHCRSVTRTLHPAADVWEYAKHLYAGLGSDLGVARCAANLAAAYQEAGDEEKALENWQECYRAADMTSVASTILALHACAELCRAFYRRHDWDQAVAYGTEALTLWADDVRPGTTRPAP